MTSLQPNRPPRYSRGEEIFNSVSHGLGVPLSAAALILLLHHAAALAPPADYVRYMAGFAVFGVSLLLLYTASTLYHALTHPAAKHVFSVFDHCGIYLLIAGTYTPYCLTALRGQTGWTLLALIWGLTIAGISLYAVFGNRFRLVSSVSYVVMGWIAIAAFKQLAAALPSPSGALLLAGGIAYTAGCVFYALKKIKWMHGVWHIFVLAGSILHFFSIYYSIQ